MWTPCFKGTLNVEEKVVKHRCLDPAGVWGRTQDSAFFTWGQGSPARAKGFPRLCVCICPHKRGARPGGCMQGK